MIGLRGSYLRRLFGVVLASVTLAALIVPATRAYAVGEGEISGRVVNGTSGGSSVSTLEITLVQYSGGMANYEERSTPVGPDGTFEFTGLPIDEGTTYAVSTTFQSATYTSQVVTLTSDNSSQAVDLTVYDSTTSDENIQVSNAHLVIYAGYGALDALQVMRFNNVGDRTFIGTGGTTLKLTLPSGVMSPSADEGSGIQFTSEGAVLINPVPPGVTDVNFSYFIPYEGSSVIISQRVDYPTADFHLLVQDTGVKVTSNTLAQGNVQDLSGTSFLDYSAGNLARGVDLDASFSGIVELSSSPGSSVPWQWLLAGAGLLLVAFIVAYPRLKQRHASPVSYLQSDPAMSTDLDEDELLSELALLDDSYAAGDIRQGEYTERRNRAKDALVQMYEQNRRRR